AASLFPTRRSSALDLLGALLVLSIHLVEEVLVNEWALLKAAWHSLLPPLSASCWDGDGGQSSCRSDGSGGGCGPPADPMGTLGGGHRTCGPHHHRAGGRPGS